jgi:hypothetical protein
MTREKNFSFFILGGLACLLGLPACVPGSLPAAPTVSSATSAPIPTQVFHLPTSIPGGQAVTYHNLRLTMNQAEITTGYETEYGIRREPTQGEKFLWVEIQLENISSSVQNLPDIDHFSAVFGASEFKPAYGHRKDYPDYVALDPELYEGQKSNVWLRFDIPSEAALKDLRFVYLPDSLQVNLSVPQDGYSWADHPQFFWECE